MYQAGDKVVYGVHGVCVVKEIEKRIVDRKQVHYLVLEPVAQDGSRYLVPTHNMAAMSKVWPMLNREALEALIVSERVHQDSWIREENLRKQYYRELIGSGDREKLLQMVCSLYRYRTAQNAAGKKFHMCDDNFLRDAEKLLASEFAIVLELTQDQARQYIRNKLKEDA